MITTFKPRGGFTLTELLVSIAIILILAVTVTVFVRSSLHSARTAQKTANLRELWATVVPYAGDHRGRLPANSGWQQNTWQHRLIRWHKGLTIGQTTTLLQQYGWHDQPPRGFLTIFNSPLNPTDGNMAFGSPGWPQGGSGSQEVFGNHGRPLSSIYDPAASVALAPYYAFAKSLIGHHWQRPSGHGDIPYDDDGYATFALVDGSVRRINRQMFEDGSIRFTYPPN